MANDSIVAFLKNYFGDFKLETLDASEKTVIEVVLSLVIADFEKPKRPARYVLGLAIDFLLQAQALSEFDGNLHAFRHDLDEEALFKRYVFVSERMGQKANTLTLSYEGKNVGIRKFEEAVASFFHAQKRTEYPSAYVYITGQWQKYRILLVECFKLSTSGRYQTATALLEYGMQKLKENEFFGRKCQRLRLFEVILLEYPRRSDKENGGLVFQAAANGYFIADRPHLCIISDKVRTGSARQKRIGDIDCYKGLDLECSIEVKDSQIDKNNVEHQLRTFSNNVIEHGVLGIVFAESVAVDGVPEDITKALVFMTLADVQKTIATWDWAKQDIAVHGMLHYLSHIEQSTEATNRLLEFIAQCDPGHASLEYFSLAPAEEPVA